MMLNYRDVPDLGRDYLENQWEDSREEVRNLGKNYPANWDGAGADSVRTELLAPALQLLRIAQRAGLPVPLYVYLTAGGTIMVEWHLNGGRILSANVRCADTAEVVDSRPELLPRLFKVKLMSQSGQVNRRQSLDFGRWVFQYALAA
jgi:hypothetical protein